MDRRPWRSSVPSPTSSALPDPALRAYVERYVQISMDVPPGETLRHRVSALTQPVAVVHWSGNVTIDGVAAADQIKPLSMSGALTRWYDNLLSGSLRSFFVHFTSTGAYTLLRLRGRGFRDRAIALADLLDSATGAEARAWGDAVARAPDLAARAAATDRFLRYCLLRVPAGPDLTVAAAARIERDGGRVRIPALAAELQCSERTLRRRFNDDLGVSVKTFARLTRFQRAHLFLQCTPGAEWAEAVARFGYVDQAHLIRDYSEFAGTSPTHFHAGERFLEAAVGLGAAG